jgi:hypothetical protein
METYQQTLSQAVAMNGTSLDDIGDQSLPEHEDLPKKKKKYTANDELSSSRLREEQ